MSYNLEERISRLERHLVRQDKIIDEIFKEIKEIFQLFDKAMKTTHELGTAYASQTLHVEKTLNEMSDKLIENFPREITVKDSIPVDVLRMGAKAAENEGLLVIELSSTGWSSALCFKCKDRSMGQNDKIKKCNKCGNDNLFLYSE